MGRELQRAWDVPIRRRRPGAEDKPGLDGRGWGLQANLVSRSASRGASGHSITAFLFLHPDHIPPRPLSPSLLPSSSLHFRPLFSLWFYPSFHSCPFLNLVSPPFSEPRITGYLILVSSVQFSSVTQLYLTLCDPMNCSTPGLPVHHQHPEFTQTHSHQVGDAIQPSHPLSSPSPPALNPSQHQGLFQ